MELKQKEIVVLNPVPPFAFDPTFHKPDHFTSGDNEWRLGIRWQTWRWPAEAGGKALGLKFINAGTEKKPKIKVEIFSDKTLSGNYLQSLTEEIFYRYNLDLDLSGFYNQFKKDKTLGPVIRKWWGMRPGHPSSLYEYLIIGIVLQNATVRRSVQMFKALLENYGELVEFDKKKLWCFWSPGRLTRESEEALRNLKVGYRAKAIKKIDDYFTAGLVNELDLRKKDRKSQMEELLKLYGVGPATVWYLLFDVFHHWDFFNHISPWEQKIYSKVFFDQDPENPVPVAKLLKRFQKYGKYKQLAVHYLWEDLWWQRKNKSIPWLEKLIRL